MKYPRIIRHGHHRADALGHVCEHVVIAETALGKALPPSAEVHHVDEDVKNNSRSNLVICQDKAFHKLLHVRARIVRAGGDPNTQHICSTCGELKDRSAFNRFSGNKSHGLQRRCRECQSRLHKGYVRPSKRRAA